MSASQDSFAHRAASAYANFILRRPLTVLATAVVLLVAAVWGTQRLTINSNQLDLISQDLPEVKEVKRVIDMVGGAGYLMLGIRNDDEKLLKAVSDDLAAMLQADKEHVRFITYKMPVEFVQKNMVLFIKTEDLKEARSRIMAYLRDQLRRANPFYIEIKKTEPVKLDLSDLIDKYSHVGKKSILDDYYISKDRKMLLILIKPMWDSNQLDKTKAYLDKLKGDWAAYSKNNSHGVTLVENYQQVGQGKEITFGYTGSYKIAVDDSYAISESLKPVTLIAFFAILTVVVLFFRKLFPALVVKAGIVAGTVLTMGFAYATVGQLNMVTSILAAILMGFGIDFGIHFVFRTRLELGQGKPYDVAVRDAVINAGRPAFVSAVVVAGSFFVLMVSQFRGFSQFGLLAGVGTPITGLVLFSVTPALLIVLGRWKPHLVERLVGRLDLVQRDSSGKEPRIPRPGLLLGIASAVVAAVCAFAVPWTNAEWPAGRNPTLWERLKMGATFNYNSRAMMPENHPSSKMQDEINDRFNISSDPIAVVTKTLGEAKEVYDELSQHPGKYPAIDQVVSIYSFVPPPETAAANAQVLAEWKEELKDIDIASLPPELQEKGQKFMEILDAKPFGVEGVPAIYASQFRELATTRPENRGYLTFIYPSVDLWDGKKMLAFADQTRDIQTASGRVYHGAGAAVLFAKLARIVLNDGRIMVLLTALWILLMHYLDFRNVKLAAASVIPLGVGLVMTLGVFNLLGQRLNFMNIIILPLLLSFGVSHGLYLLHRFLEGTSPLVALRSVGAAVASSTLTAVAGFAALFAASHHGLKSMGFLACIGLVMILVVSFTVLAAVLQLLHDRRVKEAATPVATSSAPADRSAA